MINSKMITNFIGFRMARNYWGGQLRVVKRNKLNMSSAEVRMMSVLGGRRKKVFLKELKK